MSRMRRSGFTLIEVMALLLLLSIGLAAAVGAFSAGLKLSVQGRASALAMPTAVMVAKDRDIRQLIDPELVPMWISTTYNFDAVAGGTATDRGQVNGFFVVRSETSGPLDVISSSAGVVYQRTVLVDVDVYETLGGKVMASFSTRYVRQRGGP